MIQRADEEEGEGAGAAVGARGGSAGGARAGAGAALRPPPPRPPPRCPTPRGSCPSICGICLTSPRKVESSQGSTRRAVRPSPGTRSEAVLR
eukprot:1394330-Rhodomonas_salina.2